MSKNIASALEKKIEELQAAKEKFKSFLIYAEKFEELSESEGWKALEKILKKKQQDNEKVLDKFIGLTHDQLLTTLQLRLDVKYFMGIPKDFIGDKEKAEEQLNRIQGKIDELRERIKQRN